MKSNMIDFCVLVSNVFETHCIECVFCIQFLQMNDEERFKCSLALFLTLIVSAAELNRNTQIKRKRIAGRRFSLKSTGKVHRCSRLGKSVTNFRGNIF